MTDRERFEAWMKQRYPSARLGLDLHGDYKDDLVDFMWEAWQAAKEDERGRQRQV